MALPSSDQDLSVLNIAQSIIALKPNSIHKKHISTLSFTFRGEGGRIIAWFACLLVSHRTGVLGKCRSNRKNGKVWITAFEHPFTETRKTELLWVKL